MDINKNTQPEADSSRPKKNENMLLSIIFNIAIPSFLLIKASREDLLGPKLALVVAILFPIFYMLWDFSKRRDYSIVSILGFVNVLLTGGLGLLKVEGIWFAVKEASVPGIIGLACLASLKRKKPLIYTLLFNEAVFNIEKVKSKIDTDAKNSAFNKTVKTSTIFLAFSFFLSSVLNFGLAFFLIKSPAGTEAFNQELGQMQVLSYPVIVIPSMIVMGYTFYKLFKDIKTITGLTIEDIVQSKK